MKTILITGASSGIMKSVIDQIKGQYFIYVTVHTERQLQVVSKRYEQEKNIKCFVLDVTNKKDREKIEKLQIDIFINNAAIGYGGSLIDMDLEKVRENYEVNVFSNLELTQLILKKMIDRNSGKIITMASLAGIVPISFLGSYSSSKAAIIKITETLKKELKMISNIKVCLIEPGFYNTGFNQVMFDNKNIDAYFKELKDKINREQDFIHNFIEKKKLDSIVKQIVLCINSSNPKFIYRAPMSQVLCSRLYRLFFQ